MNAEFSVFFICVEAIKYLLLYNLHDCTFNAIFNRVFFGAAHGWGWGQRNPPPSHISYNDKTWHSYALPREDPKNI